MIEHQIRVACGYLNGLVKKTVFNAKKYYSFQGVPFAEPPTGANRFKDPIPCKPWEGVKDATKHGNICPQMHEFERKIMGNEDCLFLNVYTPQIPEENGCSHSLLPVMVYIHGGGFTFGSGNEDMHGPDYLIERDIILVTINYRVGIFGFLSLGNSDVPGNAGLKDQNLALRWVRDNIKYFGGDSNNVTLFGESAGAASVHFHCLSPQSAGLFHRVILQSGCALNPWAFCENQVHRAFKMGEILGKKTNDPCEIMEFLRDQPSEILVTHQTKVLTPQERRKLSFPFVPCKEVAGTCENFLTETPETLLRCKQFAEVPCIIGITDKEGMIMLKADGDLSSKFEKLNADPQGIVPYDLCLTDACNDVAKKMKRFYCSDIPFSGDSLMNYIDVCSDVEFLIGIDKTLQYWSSKPTVPIYVYLFTFEGQLGILKAFIKLSMSDVPKGVCHADDLGYVFHNNFLSKDKFPVDKDSKEVDIIDKFCTMWTNFAKTSDPNDDKYAVEWSCYDEANPSHLVIDEKLQSVKTDILPERTEFWRNMYASVKLTNKL